MIMSYDFYFSSLENFLALVDTYDTLNSGVKNFILVGWALYKLGFKPVGVRLDSGDLAYLSKETRKLFRRSDEIIGESVFGCCNIAASNDINEEVLLDLNRQGHEINTFGIGTHLVTCQRQPALGCVYKLVEINKIPRIKLSQETEKLVIPYRKNIFRLYGQEGNPIVDVIQTSDETPPSPGERILVRHPFTETKRANVTPSRVENLLKLVWDCGRLVYISKSLAETRSFCDSQLKGMREDHIRPLNPTPFKVSVSQNLYDKMHRLWQEEAPIADLL